MVLLNLTSEKSFYKLISRGKLESRFRFGKRYVWSPELQEKYLKVRGISLGREFMKGLSNGEVDLLWEPIPRENSKALPQGTASPPSRDGKGRRSFQGLTGEEFDHLMAVEHGEKGEDCEVSCSSLKSGFRKEINGELLKLEEKIGDLSRIVEQVNGNKDEKGSSCFEEDFTGRMKELSRTLKIKDSQIKKLDSRLRETVTRLDDLKHSIDAFQNEKPTVVKAWIVPPGSEDARSTRDERQVESQGKEKRRILAEGGAGRKSKPPEAGPQGCNVKYGERKVLREKRKRTSYQVLLTVGGIVVLAFITGLLFLSLISF